MTNQPTATNSQPRQDFNPWLVYAVCLGVAAVFMFFFGLNSPIHTFNSHCDYQWFVTMGHGMVAGKVPYRDLFEQKGPIVYAVFAVACWFPHEQFVVWLFEILCVSLYLYFCYRIARKFLSPWLSLAVVPLMMMVLSANYVRGLDGSCVEEYCLPIFAYGLLCFLDFIMDQRAATWQRSLAIGICLGILLWVKFTLWTFFFVPMLIWLIVNLVHRKFATVVRSGFMMLGGVLLVTMPIVIAYAAVGALDDLFRVYFVLNICSYNGFDEYNFNDNNTVYSWKNLLDSFFIGVYFAVVMIWGLVCFAVKHWRQKSGWLLLIAVIATWLMMGFFLVAVYYYLPLFTYTVLGLIYAVKGVTHMLQSVEITIQRRWVSGLMVLLVTVISFLISFPFVRNISEINRPRADYAPLVVADIIADYNRDHPEAQPATIFGYLISDAGFYNAAGVVPNVYYYAENTFTRDAFPAMFEAFDATIRDQTCDFVVTYLYQYRKNEAFISEYYQPYFGTVEASTLPFVFYEPSAYGYNELIILFRK